VPVCRSLGRAGVPVIAVGAPQDPVRESRYCTRFIAVDGGDVASQWLEVLRTEAIQGVLIPVSDHGAELVSRHRQELVDLGYSPFDGAGDALLSMLDKGRSYEIAASAGVPVPNYVILRTEEDLQRVSDLDFPRGIKPVEGHRFRERTGLYDKVIVVHDRDELVDRAGPWLRDGHALMLTEIVEGPDDQLYALVTYVDERGEPLFALTVRKLRQDPPHFGVGAYVVHEEQPEVVEQALRVMRAAGLCGLAHVEFKRDPHDGRFKFIECNPRFALPTGLILACGVNLPLFTYRRLLGEPGPSLTTTRPGRRLWHPVPDVRAARQLRREGELTWPRYVRSVLHRQDFTLFAKDDPRPSVVANVRTVKAFLARRWPR
jgi:D-aspartate ligase